MNAIRRVGQAVRGAALLVLFFIGLLTFGAGAAAWVFIASGAVVALVFELLPWVLRQAGYRPAWVNWLEENDPKELRW